MTDKVRMFLWNRERLTTIWHDVMCCMAPGNISAIYYYIVDSFFQPGAALASDMTLSSCCTAAYLSWALSAEGAVCPVPAAVCCCCCCVASDCGWVWLRPPKSTLRDLGKALKGPVVPEDDMVRPERDEGQTCQDSPAGSPILWANPLGF